MQPEKQGMLWPLVRLSLQHNSDNIWPILHQHTFSMIPLTISGFFRMCWPIPVLNMIPVTDDTLCEGLVKWSWVKLCKVTNQFLQTGRELQQGYYSNTQHVSSQECVYMSVCLCVWFGSFKKPVIFLQPTLIQNQNVAPVTLKQLETKLRVWRHSKELIYKCWVNVT